MIDRHPGKLQQPLGTVYFLISNGLLSYHCNHCGWPQDLHIVPCFKVETILHLAYTHLLGGCLLP